MFTYEELIALGENNEEVAKFCESAVNYEKCKPEYKLALDAVQYDHNHNVTVENFERWLYKLNGQRVKDVYSANHRLGTHFFHRKNVQQVNYLLGKGITFGKADTKKKLGKDFEQKFKQLVHWGKVEGQSFIFWNVNHAEVFGYVATDTHPGFVPIYSDDTMTVKAGIMHRTKTINDEVLTIYRLYEPNGITEYTKSNKKDEFIIKPKKGYINRKVSTQAEGTIIDEWINYDNGLLPIVPFYPNDNHVSELDGYRESIDCYCLIKSGLANQIDDFSNVYWLVKNAGGMNDKDIVQMLQRLKTVHATVVDSEENGSGIEAKTLDVPYEARQKMLEILRTDLYDDMMLLDRRNMSAAQKTNQELEMAYQPQDDYTNDLEYACYSTMDGILFFVGIDDEARFTRNKIVNETEYMNMVNSAETHISTECYINHIPFLTPEEKEMEIKIFLSEQQNQFIPPNKEDENEEEEGAE